MRATPLPSPASRVAPLDAARLALARRPPDESPSPVEQAAATLWCIDQQLPSVRRMASAAGYRSPSAVVRNGRRAIDVHAAVIGREWAWIADRWLVASPLERPDRLADHALDLVLLDRSLLRLPALVGAAVVGCGALDRAPAPASLLPLHALAAFAAPETGPPAERLVNVVAAARRLARFDVGIPRAAAA